MGKLLSKDKEDSSSSSTSKPGPSKGFIFDGPSDSGKSTLVLQLKSLQETGNLVSPFPSRYISTIGLDLLKIGDTQAWDLSGNSRFQFLTSNYLTGHSRYVFVFDVTRPDSFSDCFTKLKDTKSGSFGPILVDAVFLVVGCKRDLLNGDDDGCGGEGIEASAPPQEEGSFAERATREAAAREEGCLYFEVSNKTGEGLRDLLATLLSGRMSAAADEAD